MALARGAPTMNENVLSCVHDVALATIVRIFSALNVVEHRLLIQVYFITAQFTSLKARKIVQPCICCRFCQCRGCCHFYGVGNLFLHQRNELWVASHHPPSENEEKLFIERHTLKRTRKRLSHKDLIVFSQGGGKM